MTIPDPQPGSSSPASERSFDARKAKKASIRNLSATERARIRNFGWGSSVTGDGSMCREAGLLEPDFEQRAGQWVVTIWRDWLTDEVLARHNLSERKRRNIQSVEIRGEITNSQYQQEFSVAKRTASLDLTELVAQGLLEREGRRGKRGIGYSMPKRLINGSYGPSRLQTGHETDKLDGRPFGGKRARSDGVPCENTRY
jgi:hypothetical protein